MLHHFPCFLFKVFIDSFCWQPLAGSSATMLPNMKITLMLDSIETWMSISNSTRTNLYQRVSSFLRVFALTEDTRAQHYLFFIVWDPWVVFFFIEKRAFKLTFTNSHLSVCIRRQVGIQFLAQGCFDIQIWRIRDQTTNLPISSTATANAELVLCEWLAPFTVH